VTIAVPAMPPALLHRPPQPGLGRDWEDLARLDPFWAILVRPSRRYGRWDLQEFLSTGDQEAAAFLGRAGQLGWTPPFRAVLDYGCGVGRMTRALARHAGAAVGVDISATMIQLARTINADVSNCTFALLESDPSDRPEAPFDLIYCSRVLQHSASTRAVAEAMRLMVAALAPGGLLMIQMPEGLRIRHRLQLRRRLYAMLRACGVRPEPLYRRLRLHPMRMIAMGESEVAAILERAGARVVAADHTVADGGGVANVHYYATSAGPSE
jgi:SAM-dependent methyltransferase